MERDADIQLENINARSEAIYKVLADEDLQDDNTHGPEGFILVMVSGDLMLREFGFVLGHGPPLHFHDSHTTDG
jgi:hypothetical protein